MKVHIDQHGKLQKDYRAILGESDFVGQVEVESLWPSGYGGFALALGSLWALIPGAIATLILVVRTGWEDRTLQNELDGYREYASRVRYRLIPRVW